MNFLKNLFKSNQTPGPTDGYWYEPVSPTSAAGVRVTHDKAMQIATVYSCVNLLANSIASLPLMVYRRLPDGGKQEAADHPLYNLLKYQPNDWQTKFNFTQMMVGHLALRGNYYAEILTDRGGSVTGLLPLNPARMKVELLKNDTVRYTYQDEQGREIRYLPGELLRVHGLSSDGLTGMSVIQQARETFGSAIQTQEYANRFFANDARPGGILKSDTPIDEKSRTANKESWERAHRGAKNAHKVAILYGLNWQQVGMSNSDSQFLETRKFNRSEICGLFGVPPHLIADLERATFSNIEHQDIGYYKHTIRPWLVNIEQSIKRDLITEPDVFAEFKIDGLLRGDSKSRSEYYAKALGSGGTRGWMTQNEVRALENLNPMDGGDELPQPITKGTESPAQGTEDDEDDENA